MAMFCLATIFIFTKAIGIAELAEEKGIIVRSPTARTLKKLRTEGWICQVVERFNSFSKQRIDLFSFGDIVAMRPGEIALVQTTSGSNVAARIEKIKSLPTFKQWYDAGGTVIVHGWRKLKREGWQCRELKTQRNVEHIAIDIVTELRYERLIPKLTKEQGIRFRQIIAEIVTKGYKR